MDGGIRGTGGGGGGSSSSSCSSIHLSSGTQTDWRQTPPGDNNRRNWTAHGTPGWQAVGAWLESNWLHLRGSCQSYLKPLGVGMQQQQQLHQHQQNRKQHQHHQLQQFSFGLTRKATLHVTRRILQCYACMPLRYKHWCSNIMGYLTVRRMTSTLFIFPSIYQVISSTTYALFFELRCFLIVAIFLRMEPWSRTDLYKAYKAIRVT